jgi:MFS family permease
MLSNAGTQVSLFLGVLVDRIGRGRMLLWGSSAASVGRNLALQIVSDRLR